MPYHINLHSLHHGDCYANNVTCSLIITLADSHHLTDRLEIVKT